MFATEPKNECRTRPATTATYGDHSIQAYSYTQAQLKLKKAKQLAKQTEKYYQTLRSNVSSIKKSIQQYKHRTCIERVHFIKSYETRKLRIQERQLSEQQKISVYETTLSRKRQAKMMKVNAELQSIVNNCEHERTKQNLRVRNKTEKTLRKTSLQERRLEEHQEARRKYEQIRYSQLQLAEQKKRWEEHMALRARLNYHSKLERQMQLIQSFDNVLKQAERYEDEEGQLFFVTGTNNTHEHGL